MIITLHNVCAVHRGCAVQWGMFSTPRGYHEYNRGGSVHWGDIMINAGEGHWDKNKWICMETPVYWTSPGVLIISPQCTEHPPGYSVISPSVLNILWCTAHPPVYCTNIMQGDYPSCSLRHRLEGSGFFWNWYKKGSIPGVYMDPVKFRSSTDRAQVHVQNKSQASELLMPRVKATRIRTLSVSVPNGSCIV